MLGGGGQAGQCGQAAGTVEQPQAEVFAVQGGQAGHPDVQGAAGHLHGQLAIPVGRALLGNVEPTHHPSRTK